MAPQGGNPPFTAFGTDAPNTASFNSLMASLMSEASTSPESVVAATTALPSEATSASSITKPSSAGPESTTLSTVPLSSPVSTSSTITATSTSRGTPDPTSSSAVSSVTNAASNANGGLTESDSCNSVSCSPGLQAAVAVPVVVGVLAIIALVFFLAKRRRKQSRGSTGIEEKPKKKWTRHLRIFSFDAELLTGGRFSSSNSMRSGESSQHVAGNTQNRDNPSLHSIDEAAPPYRGTLSHAHHPNMTQMGPGLAAGGLAGGLAASTVPRPESRVGAPPPYDQSEARSSGNPTSQGNPYPPIVAVTNPFSDSNPASPVDGSSPFTDSSEDGTSIPSRPVMSRNSSVRTGTSTFGETDAGSIQEAQVGRHVSVASGGRTIAVRNSSQSPPLTP